MHFLSLAKNVGDWDWVMSWFLAVKNELKIRLKPWKLVEILLVNFERNNKFSSPVCKRDFTQLSLSFAINNAQPFTKMLSSADFKWNVIKPFDLIYCHKWGRPQKRGNFLITKKRSLPGCWDLGQEICRIIFWNLTKWHTPWPKKGFFFQLDYV